MDKKRKELSLKFNNVKVISYLDKSILEQIWFKLALKSLGGERLVSADHYFKEFYYKGKESNKAVTWIHSDLPQKMLTQK